MIRKMTGMMLAGMCLAVTTGYAKPDRPEGAGTNGSFWSRLATKSRELRAGIGSTFERNETVRRGPGSISVKTCFGVVELAQSQIAEIRTDDRDSAACLVTTHGEVFVSSSPLSHRWRVSLMGVDWIDESSGKLPARIKLSCAGEPMPSGWLTWRLSGGDLFYAQVAQEVIVVKSRDSGRMPIEIRPESLVSLMRDDDRREFVFRTTDGDVRGHPESSRIALRLLCNNATSNIPFHLVEQARRCAPEEMPPAALPAPSAIPLLEGTVRIPGGWFAMGNGLGGGMDDELPCHDVKVSPFFMDACEVTRSQFAAFVQQSGYRTDAEVSGSVATWRNPGFLQAGDEPAVCVSWRDAARFCNWRSRRTGLNSCYEFRRRGEEIVCHRSRNGYRLPTEAEWEYAARCGGQDIMYPWEQEEPGDRRAGVSCQEPGGGNLGLGIQSPESGVEPACSFANFKQKSDDPQDNWTWTNPVQAFPENALGLYGMAGNVWEWCEDWYFEQAYSAVHRRLNNDPCVEAGHISHPTRRVMRGGSFDNELDVLRCAARGSGPPCAGANRVGFRCVRSARPAVP